ncbi:hypothetical protein CA13_42980 [Planctomycetes bacterium CA13]|uniref:Uncharacterized protein n=1 Tax=Novipirellula herctigrandis TaxID=2527986 RepID=A0A5C5Z6I9_9BACT|nr:hypothetical protein CA13_42980 [Planctomycetes bacterium CA13]
MHKFLSIVALSVAVLVVPRAYANDDLDSLLDELNFNEPQLVGDSDLSSDPASQLVSQQPTWSDPQMQLDVPQVEDQDGFSYQPLPDDSSSQAPLPIPDPESQHLVNAPSMETTNLEQPMPANHVSMGYQGAIQAQPMHGGGCGCASCQGAYRAPACGCQACDGRGCDSCFAGHRHACKQPDQYVCIPRRGPNLPTSTSLQSFRSRPCASGLWDGFAQERMKQCAKHHKHIHGMCDCAEKSQASCHLLKGPPRCPPYCTSCDSGGGGCCH